MAAVTLDPQRGSAPGEREAPDSKAGGAVRRCISRVSEAGIEKAQICADSLGFQESVAGSTPRIYP